MRTHVLYLIDELCRKGGAESALLKTVQSLPPERFRCSVITFRLNASLPMLADFRCPVQVFPLRCTHDWNALRTGVSLARFIHREKVDIVHTFFASADLWGGAIAKLSRRPALISSRRDMGFLRTSKHRLAYRALHPMFDRVLAVSEQVRRYSIEQDRLDPTKVTTLYNAVDTPNLASQESAGAVRALLGVSSAAPIIVSVGNLREIKGFDVLIRAAAKVCRDYPETMFIIAGGTDPREPECLSQLSELSSSLGVGSNVKFLGAVEDVIPFLQASNVFCLLSHSEGFSNALLEAMACGIPCIATRVGGNSEAIEEGRTGFLVEDNDDGATAERILEVLRDPAQAKRIGSSAVEAVTRRFAPEIVMSQLVETYDNVLAQKRESRRAESR